MIRQASFAWRTKWLPLTAILLLLAFTAACGADNGRSPNGDGSSGTSPSPSADASGDAPEAGPTPDSSDGGQAAEPDGTGTASGTKLFTDDLGRQVEIPVSSQRPVLCEFSPEALTVGVQPAAVCPNDLRNSYTKDRLAGIADIGDPPNVEQILDLKPDLLVFSSFYPDIYPEVTEQLEKIAPVVYLSFQDPIYDVFPKVAEALGKPQEAQDWIRSYEADRDAAQSRVKAAIGDETVSILRIEKGRLRIYLSTNYGGYVARTALGLKAPQAVADEIAKDRWKNAVQISLEKLPEYAGDHLMVIVAGDDDARGEYKEIQQSALWKSLPAVKNGKVHPLDSDNYYNADILTVRETMKEMADLLAGAAQ